MPAIDPHSAALLVIAILVVYMLHKVMAGANQLQWWQFIGTKGKDGKTSADVDKLGKVIGIIIASWVMVRIADNDKIDLLAFAAVFAAYLGFVGGVAGYSAFLRSKDRGSRDDREDKGK